MTPSYRLRAAAVQHIYPQYAPLGVPNRTIWRRHIKPTMGICERTFYNLLKVVV